MVNAQEYSQIMQGIVAELKSRELDIRVQEIEKAKKKEENDSTSKIDRLSESAIWILECLVNQKVSDEVVREMKRIACESKNITQTISEAQSSPQN